MLLCHVLFQLMNTDICIYRVIKSSISFIQTATANMLIHEIWSIRDQINTWERKKIRHELLELSHWTGLLSLSHITPPPRRKPRPSDLSSVQGVEWNGVWPLTCQLTSEWQKEGGHKGGMGEKREEKALSLTSTTVVTNTHYITQHSHSAQLYLLLWRYILIYYLNVNIVLNIYIVYILIIL